MSGSRLCQERICPQCGKWFYSERINRVWCTRACSMRAWRAVKMLEGTHGQVGGLFVRLST